MSADKRTPHTDALETLGYIHDRQEHRDAIHLAVEQVTAGANLKPGDEIGLKDGIAFKGTLKNGIKNLGIVDPFLKQNVQKGDAFWLVVFPRAITSLRHVWSHPDFDETAEVLEIKAAPIAQAVVSPKDLAYAWISDYAESFGREYDYENDSYTGSGIDAHDLIEYGRDMVDSNKNGTWGDYLVRGGLLEGESTSAEFWNQLEIYLGEEISHDHRSNFFSCSC